MEEQQAGKKPDLIARVAYYTAEQGGRRTPAVTGHRPQTKFEGASATTPAEQVFADEMEYILPGGSAQAEITLVSKAAFAASLYEGQMFEFFDGEKPIGSGTVLKVLNPELKR